MVSSRIRFFGVIRPPSFLFVFSLFPPVGPKARLLDACSGIFGSWPMFLRLLVGVFRRPLGSGPFGILLGRSLVPWLLWDPKARLLILFL